MTKRRNKEPNKKIIKNLGKLKNWESVKRVCNLFYYDNKGDLYSKINILYI